MSATVLYDPGEARPARLFVWDASRALRTVPVESGMTLGRAGPDSTADLPLQSSIVSRRHGEILQLDDGYCYRDLGSLNGTHVNGVLTAAAARRTACACRTATCCASTGGRWTAPTPTRW